MLVHPGQLLVLRGLAKVVGSEVAYAPLHLKKTPYFQEESKTKIKILTFNRHIYNFMFALQIQKQQIPEEAECRLGWIGTAI